MGAQMGESTKSGAPENSKLKPGKSTVITAGSVAIGQEAAKG